MAKRRCKTDMFKLIYDLKRFGVAQFNYFVLTVITNIILLATTIFKVPMG